MEIIKKKNLRRIEELKMMKMITILLPMKFMEIKYLIK